MIGLTKFKVQKRGHHAAEYEDAFAFSQGPNEIENSFRVAIADGATESSFAGEWARMLVRSFRDRFFEDIQDLQARTEQLSKKWQGIVYRRPLPWFAEEKARMGAFSTLLGLELFATSHESEKVGTWRAIAVGDSCFFQIRDNALYLAFPIERSSDFGNTPVMISSNVARNRTIWDRVIFREGDWRTGDKIILATDALSAWFVQVYEHGEHPWNEILSLTLADDPQSLFVDWINQRRISLMKNDDVTCLVIAL